jgi:hypothetical protein
MTSPDDWHAGRGAALVAVLGPAAVARLMQQFRAELAALAPAAQEETEAALAQRLHRVAGAAGSLALDSAAAALAGGEAALAAGAGRPAVIAAVAEAGRCRDRGWAALVAAHPGAAGHDPAVLPGILKE